MARTGIMLCQPMEQHKIEKWTSPFICQPKLDGERARYQEGLLLSSEENPFFLLPHILSELKELQARVGFLPELDGEVYVHGLTFEKIHSIVSREVNLHPEFEKMEYHIFDIIDESSSQIKRLQVLKMLKPFLEDLPHLKIVQTKIAYDFEEIMLWYDNFLSQDYEGIIVRHLEAPYVRKRSPFMMKFKPKKTDLYRIIGMKEEVSIHGELKGRMGALVCTGTNNATFTVSGFTDELKNLYWDNPELVIGKDCLVSYQNITSTKGVPRFGTFKSIQEP